MLVLPDTVYHTVYMYHTFDLYHAVTAPLRQQAPPMEAESMVINVAGKLFMFQRDRTGPQPKDAKDRPVSAYSIFISRSSLCMHKI